MKRTSVSALFAVILLSSAACLYSPLPALGGTQYEKVTLKMSTIGTETNSDTQSARKLAAEVLEETGGNIKIEVYPTDQLAGGDMTKSVELLAMGTTDIMISSVGTLSSINQKLQVSNLPWLFADYEEANRVIQATGAKFWNKLLEERGIMLVDYIHNGLRQVTNGKRPIKTPDDVKGLKIRVPGGAVYMAVFRALGADPVAMNWSEVFTALQQGTIDGQENGFTVTNSNNLFEVQKYLTVWNYMYECNLCVVNKRKFEKLRPETQEYLRRKIGEACAWGRNMVETGEDALKAKFIEKGMEIHELTDSELAAFRAAVRQVREEYQTKYGKEACAAFGVTP